MFDLWASKHSVLREKVIEHIFLAELSRTLLLDLELPFEVLRAEFDASGYDVAIEAAGLLRHVQLKAMKKGGKRANVDVPIALADKPGGCIVWIVADPETLTVGPFYWFGDDRGGPLPPLGDRVVRHTKGDATGHKKEREGLRRLSKGMFTRIDSITDLAKVMFPPLDHRLLLERHLGSQADLAAFAPLAEGMTWEESGRLAYLIDGYKLAERAGISDPVAFADARRDEAERTGRWNGSALELWLALFMEHRRDHFGGAIGMQTEPEPQPILNELCRALAAALSEGR